VANDNRGKQLSALLQILRSHGVTSYQTPELTLILGPAPPPKHVTTSLNVSPEALAAERHGEDDPEDEEGDPRFFLERIQPRLRRKADPNANGRTQ